MTDSSHTPMCFITQLAQGICVLLRELSVAGTGAGSNLVRLSTSGEAENVTKGEVGRHNYACHMHVIMMLHFSPRCWHIHAKEDGDSRPRFFLQ